MRLGASQRGNQWAVMSAGAGVISKKGGRAGGSQLKRGRLHVGRIRHDVQEHHMMPARGPTKAKHLQFHSGWWSASIGV